MGEVFEAVRTGPGGFRRPVALKRLDADAAIRGESIQRFLAEARVLARLDHQNVIEVHDVIAGDRGYVIVMELLRGATFGGVVRAARDTGGVSVAEVLAIADQALAGLAHVHAARGDDDRPLGLVHRDITPGNLFVTDAGVVKLLDFGIAKLREAIDAPVTRDGEIHGTLELLAPEQARGEPADVTTDLYQLGACMYWALGGRYPHGSGTSIELIARAALSAPMPLSELAPELPAAVVAVVARAMASERVARFAAASEMRETLAPLLVPRDAAAALLAERVRGVLAAEPVPVPVPAPAPVPVPVPVPASGVSPDAPTAPAASAVERGPVTAPPTPRPTRTDRRRVIAAGAILVGLGAGALAARALLSRDHVGTTGDDATPRVPGLLAATIDRPLLGVGLDRDGTQLAIATGRELLRVPATGGAPVPVALARGVAPVDVDVLADGTLIATSQDDDGLWRTVEIGQPGPDGAATAIKRDYATQRRIVRIAPDGKTQLVTVTGGGIYRQRGTENVKLIDGGRDALIPAIAWAPDGTRFAFVRWRDVDVDASIEISDPDGRIAGIVQVKLPLGEPRVFGWLDGDHLAYTVNTEDGAAVYRVDLVTRLPEVVAREEHAVITGGSVAGNTIAYLRGIPRYSLGMGPLAGPLMPARAAFTQHLAGWLDGQRVVASGRLWKPSTFDDRGVGTPWSSAANGDDALTLVDGVLLVLRGDADREIWRLGDDARRIAGAGRASRATAVRCTDDRVAPCVRGELDRQTGNLVYATWDPSAGTYGTPIDDVFVTPAVTADHAVAADGRVAVVYGADEIRILVAGQDERRLHVEGGVALDHVAWAGGDLVVTGRQWRGRPWVALRVSESGAPLVVRPIEDSTTGWIGIPRVSPDGRLAIARTDLDIELVVRTLR